MRIDAPEDPSGAAGDPVIAPGLAAPEPPLRRARGLPPFLLTEDFGEGRANLYAES